MLPSGELVFRRAFFGEIVVEMILILTGGIGDEILRTESGYLRISRDRVFFGSQRHLGGGAGSMVLRFFFFLTFQMPDSR